MEEKGLEMWDGFKREEEREQSAAEEDQLPLCVPPLLRRGCNPSA